MKMNPTVFREYDIRGLAEKDFDADFAHALGRAIGARLRRAHPGETPTVAVGRDCRATSGPYAEAMMRGFNETGVDVIDIGVGPTPLMYFSLFHLPVNGGVEITASHNAGPYNGFKICMGRESIHGEEIASLRTEIEAGDFPSGAGTTRQQSVTEDYLGFCTEQFGTLRRRLKVVVDAGNGAAAEIGPELVRRLGCDVVPLYCEYDGTFPNHHPDPTVEENLQDVIEAVDAEGADLGIAFDGDGDRIGVVAPGGRILWGDEVLVVFAREILSRKPGAVVISEVKCSQRLYDDVEKHGGKAIMWKAGHSLIKAKMRETDAAIGGEMSGHMFFADRFFGYDDAVYAAGRLLEILAASDGGVLDLLSDLPSAHTTPELRIDCDDTTKFQIVDRVRDRLRAEYPVIDVDGVRANFGEGWGLVRASNTQPALVLRFEAVTAERRDEYRAMVEGIVAEVRAELGA